MTPTLSFLARSRSAATLLNSSDSRECCTRRVLITACFAKLSQPVCCQGPREDLLFIFGAKNKIAS